MAKKKANKKHDRELLLLKYDSICQEFRKLSSIKEHNVSKYSMEYILNHLSNTKFFIKPDTIAAIVRNEPKGGYKSSIKKQAK